MNGFGIFRSFFYVGMTIEAINMLLDVIPNITGGKVHTAGVFKDCSVVLAGHD